jgi:REP element-mobilizing transposase RayT
MSKARPVYPGAVVFTTRRVHKRQFLLRPDDRVNQLLEYVVAVLVQRYQILLHALCALSNHMHDVASDPEGCIVEFRRDLHAILARALNARYGEFESLWSREPTCRVTCVERNDVIGKIAYTMANPVGSRQSARPNSTAGLMCTAEAFGGSPNQ